MGNTSVAQDETSRVVMICAKCRQECIPYIPKYTESWILSKCCGGAIYDKSWQQIPQHELAVEVEKLKNPNPFTPEEEDARKAKYELLWKLRSLEAPILRLQDQLNAVGMAVSASYMDLVLLSVNERIEEVKRGS